MQGRAGRESGSRGRRWREEVDTAERRRGGREASLEDVKGLMSGGRKAERRQHKGNKQDMRNQEGIRQDKHKEERERERGAGEGGEGSNRERGRERQSQRNYVEGRKSRGSEGEGERAGGLKEPLVTGGGRNQAARRS